MNYVALLRAVNVGKRPVKMKELQALFTELGFADAITHIQTGNVLFTSPAGETALIQQLEPALSERFGFEIRVLMRSAAELREIVTTCPFAGADSSDGIKRYVSFLSSEPSAELRDFIAANLQSAEETNTVVGRELYTTHATGIAKSLFTTKLKEKKWGILITNRNWTVVQKLDELLSAGA